MTAGNAHPNERVADAFFIVRILDAPPERLVMTMDCSEHAPEWRDLVDPQCATGDKDPFGEVLITLTFGRQGAVRRSRSSYASARRRFARRS